MWWPPGGAGGGHGGASGTYSGSDSVNGENRIDWKVN